MRRRGRNEWWRRKEREQRRQRRSEERFERERQRGLTVEVKGRLQKQESLITMRQGVSSFVKFVSGLAPGSRFDVTYEAKMRYHDE